MAETLLLEFLDRLSTGGFLLLLLARLCSRFFFSFLSLDFPNFLFVLKYVIK